MSVMRRCAICRVLERTRCGRGLKRASSSKLSCCATGIGIRARAPGRRHTSAIWRTWPSHSPRSRSPSPSIAARCARPTSGSNVSPRRCRGQLKHWRMRPVVEALMTLRGIDMIAAVTLVAEIGDFQRFARPSELMGFLGLVPSEYSSGSTRRQGAITKTGNGHARRVLVEAAWNYRFPARISRILQVRQEGQPKAVREIAWRAQLRLAHRYRRLSSRQIHPNKICVAVARELTGFIWDVACHVKAVA